MITINFLQNNAVPKIGNLSLRKKMVFVASLILSLVVAPVALARVPEDFMTQPTVLHPITGPVASDELVVRGLAYNWAFVDIFIDGNHAGRATTKNSPKGVASFAFRPRSISKGIHHVQAMVRSETEVFRSPLTSSIVVEVVDPTPAPTLFTFAGSDDFRRPWIRGIAATNTTVKIFIDGVFDQEFSVSAQGLPTATFSVNPTRDLANGFHTVRAMSIAGNGVASKSSNTRTFLVAQSPSRVEDRAPGLVETPSTGLSNPKAPTLVAPKTGSVAGTTKPTISGFAHNDLLIRAFVDKILDQEFAVKNHPSGTTQFTFLPKNELKSGDHTVYVRAEDRWGNRSSHSNEVNFLVRPEGLVSVFSPEGVSQKSYPPLVRPQTGKTSSANTPVSPVSNVKGTTDQKPTNQNANVNAWQLDADQTGVQKKSPANTRKIIGWIILGISVLGIIAYIVAAVVESKKKKQSEALKTNQPKPGVNFAHPYGSRGVPPADSQQNKTLQPDIPDLDDDIPKGYQ